MSPRITLATAARVLRQLRHDPRTIALLLVVPVVLETLLRLVYDGKPAIFDRIGAPLLGIFPLITMFLVTSIATLRERTSGTLERLLTMPLAKLDLLLGYALAFGAFAVLQVAIATGVALTVLGLDVAGPGPGSSSCSRSPTRCWAPRWGCSSAPLPPASSRPSSSCQRSSCPSCCCAGCCCRASRCRRCCGGSPTCCRCRTPWTPCPGRVTITTGVPNAVLADLAIVPGCIVAALGLGAATLRRRTA